MIRGIAPKAAGLLGAGVVAATAAPLAQLLFAVVGIGVVGMLHGAGDLAVVERGRRPLFLLAYGLVSLFTLLWWTGDPAVALPAFLAASAVHFGIEDAPNGTLYERVARGLALIAAPATLHMAGYAGLVRSAGGPSAVMDALVPLLAVSGGIAAVALLGLAWVRRDARLGMGIAALLLLPPLVGFTLGFLILHALPQTTERRVRLGYADTRSYLMGVAPIFAGAIVLAGLVAALLLHHDPTGVRGLFAGIAALAVPHLLVTPWFEARSAVARPVPG